MENKKVSIWLGLGVFFVPIIFAWLTLKKGYSTRAKAISFTWLLVTAALTILTPQSKQADAENLAVEPTSIPSMLVNYATASDYTYTMSNQAAVSIAFGKDKDNFCDITLHRKDINQGFSTTLANKSSGDISSSCSWNNGYYIQSSKNPTIASVTIKSLDKENKIALLIASLKLVNSKNDSDFFEINDAEIKLTNEQFDNLITMPSDS